MDVTPPPALDSRIEEWGDRLIVRYRRSDRWWAHGRTLLFLGFWGVCVVSSVLALFRGQLEGAVGVILWFAVGAFGGWHLFKTDVLTVTPAFVELRRELSGRSRTR